MKTLRIPSLAWAAIMLCSMLFAAAQDVAAEVYMTIGGKEVTSDNYQHITAANGFTAIKSGSVDYDPSSARLTLDGATIEAATSSGIQFSTATTVLLIGANAITGPQAIIMNENVTITGSGSLACTGSSAYCININKNKALTIDGCTFAVQASTYGIQSVVDSQRGSLIVNNANVRVAGPSGSICKLASMTMTGCGITLPEGAAWTPAQNAVCDASGNIVMTEIQIERLVPITSTTFPNSVFRQFVGTNYDANHDGHLSESEIAAVTSMDFRYTEATSLQGIEHFAALEHLSCNDNQIAELDLSQNLALKTVACQNNQLTSLNIGNATQLQQLYCNNNQLSTLNVANFPNLHYLNCQDNQLTSLSFAGCATLENVFAFNNRLTALDISGCSALRILSIYNNSIKQNEMDNIIGQLPVRTSAQTGSITLLDPGQDEGNEYSDDNVENAELKWWYVYGFDGTNPIYIKADYVAIDVINFPNANFRNYVSTFDTNQNGALSMHELQAATEINVNNMLISDLTGIEYFTALQTLSIQGCGVLSLDLSKNIRLTTLHCEYNTTLHSIDLTENTMIQQIYCNGCSLTPEGIQTLLNSLPGSATASSLTIFEKSSYDLNDIVLTTAQINAANAKNWHIYILNNNATEELTSGVVRLWYKQIPDANFLSRIQTNYDLNNDWLLSDTEAQAVTSMDVSNFNIGDLTGIERFTNLETLACNDNHISFLDVTHNTHLTDLQCQNNQIAVLAVTGTDLYTLNCYGNQIKGSAMNLLIDGLPAERSTTADLIVYNTIGSEGNDRPTTAQVELATSKNWNVLTMGDTNPSSVDPVEDIEINKINFPDDNFRAIISEKGDLDCDGILSAEEILKFRYLPAHDEGIESLKGIEYLVAIETIDCAYNQITSLDLSKNTALTILFCSNNPLNTLNVSHNTQLVELHCTRNQLTALDLSHNPLLKSVHCYRNIIRDENMDAFIQSLPTVSGGKLFLFIGNINYRDENYITPAQIQLVNAKGWDVLWEIPPRNVSMLHMGDEDIPINATFFPDANFRQFVSETYDTNHDGILQNKESVAVSDINVSGKNIADLTGLGFFEHLQTLDCRNNQLTSLDLSYFWLLTRVDCYQNHIQGDNMEALIQSLVPSDSQATLMLYYTGDGEQNTMATDPQIYLAQKKSWFIYTFSGHSGTIVEPAQIAIDSINFPDSIFRNYISEEMDWDNDGYLSCEEREYATMIDVYDMGITSLQGVEHFTNLQELYCEQNELTTLDLSQNTQLDYLQCDGNELTSLDLSHNPALNHLTCSNNPLTSLNLSNNPALSYLSCYFCDLATLDLSHCPALELICCFSNQLTSLDLSHNPALKHLTCNNNQLTQLDLSHNWLLEKVYCYKNQLSFLNLSKNKMLTDLACYSNKIAGTGMSQLVATLPTVSSGILEVVYYDDPYEQNAINSVMAKIATSKGWTLKAYRQQDFTIVYPIDAAHFPDANFRQFVSENYDRDQDDKLSKAEAEVVEIMHIEEMGISDLTGIEYFTELKELYCQNSFDTTEGRNHLTSLDLSGNTQLTRLACGQNEISSLNISQCTELGNLHCGNNQLTNLNVTNNTKLWRLYCINNQLSVINLSNNNMLKILDIDGNQLTHLDLSGRTTLEGVSCGKNPLSEFSVTGCTALKRLQILGASFTALDLSTNTALERLTCDSVPISTLDLSHNTALSHFVFQRNHLLQSLDFSQNTHLKYFGLYITDVSTISGLSNNTELETVLCGRNDQLSALDLSGCTALEYLECINSSQLSTLNLAGCTILQNVDCYDNQLTQLNLAGCEHLHFLDCYNNQLPQLDLSQNASLLEVDCSNNQLTSLLLSPDCWWLYYVDCSNNCLRGGEAVDSLIQSLPDYSGASGWSHIVFKDRNDGIHDQNFASADQAVIDCWPKKWLMLEKKNDLFYYYIGTTIGDVNNDNRLNGDDLTTLVNVIIGKEDNYDFGASDINGDGIISLADVTALANMLNANHQP